MQALIVAISLYLFSSTNSNETQIENTTILEEDHIVELAEVKSCTSLELLEVSDFLVL